MNLASEVIIVYEGMDREPAMHALPDPLDSEELHSLLCSSLGRPPDDLTIDGHGVAVARYYSPPEATA